MSVSRRNDDGADIVQTIFDLFDRFGDQNYGEDVNQRDHALQVAHNARADGAPDTLVAAGLLHDIGQFLGGAGEAAALEDRDARHEQSGASYLAAYLPASVVEPIRLHVAAKRYLCAVEPDYLATLSDASQLSLRLQGGAFDIPAVAAFRLLDHARDAVRLRRYDDMGKCAGFSAVPLEYYRSLLTGLLTPQHR